MVFWGMNSGWLTALLAINLLNNLDTVLPDLSLISRPDFDIRNAIVSLRCKISRSENSRQFWRFNSLFSKPWYCSIVKYWGWPNILSPMRSLIIYCWFSASKTTSQFKLSGAGPKELGDWRIPKRCFSRKLKLFLVESLRETDRLTWEKAVRPQPENQ